MAVFVSLSAEQTIAFARQYAKTLKGGTVLLLNGEMGAGKTVFCKGLALGLGIEEEVLSPTYAYMNDYDGKLYHYDCYRLKCGEQAEALGLTDYFYGNGICVVEWAENISSVLPENCLTVTIKKTGENTREITYDGKLGELHE
jgi:tRNA threonylcarbamoyladenosine biosynthesis protein TsaE